MPTDHFPDASKKGGGPSDCEKPVVSRIIDWPSKEWQEGNKARNKPTARNPHPPFSQRSKDWEDGYAANGRMKKCKADWGGKMIDCPRFHYGICSC